MQPIFVGKDKKLRSGWRALLFIFFFMFAAAICYSIEMIAFTASPLAPYVSRLTFVAVNASVLVALSLGLGYIAGRVFEGLSFSVLGASFHRNWLKNSALGLTIGTATLLVAVGVSAITGGHRFALNETGFGEIASSMLASLAVFALSAAWEEAFFRGYILQTFERAGLAWLAILLTSVFFGIVHADNTNASLLSVVNTILAGIWFALAYLKTRDLWFVWGMHFIWNWLQGAVFGIEVSGMTEFVNSPLLKEIDHGPTWLTGTTYGIEGGVACTIALLVSIGVIWFAKSEPPAVAGG